MKELLTGLTVPQQYICIPLEDFSNPLSVYLSGTGNDEFLDVTNTHLFLGYQPLIIAAIFPREKHALACERVNLHFLPWKTETNGVSTRVSSKDWVARLTLRRILTRKISDKEIVFYQGEYGAHRFINQFHQFFNNQRERLRKVTPNNVSLPGNSYDQVRIAYSVPRIIALITVCDGNKMNIFPTDLHGPFQNDFYLSSLRIGGKANRQVEEAGRLVLSFMPVEQYKAVYEFGKNHMQPMLELSNFPIERQKSKNIQFPVPASALRYKELERFDSFDAGIHRIHFYQVLDDVKLQDGYTLAHIHQYYAQWRIDRMLPLNMFLR